MKNQFYKCFFLHFQGVEFRTRVLRGHNIAQRVTVYAAIPLFPSILADEESPLVVDSLTSCKREIDAYWRGVSKDEYSFVQRIARRKRREYDEYL